MSNTDDWQRAFALQAKADFEIWDELKDCQHALQCHRLHFLQMACEKLAKAHLCETGAEPHAIQQSHAYIAKSLPRIAKHHVTRRKGHLRKHGSLFKKIRHLAREIELLAPAVDDGGRRQDNCEYPWELANGELRIPAEHSFPNLSLLREPAGRTLLKVVREAVAQLLPAS